MRRNIQKAAPFELTLNFNQQISNLPQQPNRYGDVINAG